MTKHDEVHIDLDTINLDGMSEFPVEISCSPVAEELTYTITGVEGNESNEAVELAYSDSASNILFVHFDELLNVNEDTTFYKFTV